MLFINAVLYATCKIAKYLVYINYVLVKVYYKKKEIWLFSKTTNLKAFLQKPISTYINPQKWRYCKYET